MQAWRRCSRQQEHCSGSSLKRQSRSTGAEPSGAAAVVQLLGPGPCPVPSVPGRPCPAVLPGTQFLRLVPTVPPPQYLFMERDLQADSDSE